MNKNLEKILAAREKRYQIRLDLHKEYNSPIIVITMNIPGPDKNNRLINKAFCKVIIEISKILAKQKIVIKKKIVDSTPAGPESFLVLDFNGNYHVLKEKLIKIEETHYLGRLLDLDLYGIDNNPISRNSIAKKERKCLICQKDARECIIEKRHSLKELKAKVNRLILQYLENNLESV